MPLDGGWSLFFVRRQFRGFATMSLQSRIALSLAAAVLWHSAPAMAADYEPPIVIENAPEYVPVEVGSGWYLRGDLGYTFNKPFKVFDIGVLPIAAYSEDNTALFGGVGMGYHFNDFLRGELNFAFLSKNKFGVLYDDGTLGVLAYGKNQAWSGMANAYVDLGTFVGLTPYVGAGLGFVYTKRELHVDLDTPFGGVEIFDNKKQVSFAYSLGAGLNYQVTPNTSIDVGYQFLSAPDAQYVAVKDLDSYPVHKGINLHQLKVGLRYDLW